MLSPVPTLSLFPSSSCFAIAACRRASAAVAVDPSSAYHRPFSSIGSLSASTGSWNAYLGSWSADPTT